MSYHGAGILFYARKELTFSVLLAQRKRSGVWSIPGGSRDAGDADPWSTASRETIEEFGRIPEMQRHCFSLRCPFAIVGFHWTTFVIEIPDPPPITVYPDRMADDFTNEFRTAAWFSIKDLPRKTHWLLYPVIWRLRMLAL